MNWKNQEPQFKTTKMAKLISWFNKILLQSKHFYCAALLSVFGSPVAALLMSLTVHSVAVKLHSVQGGFRANTRGRALLQVRMAC